MYSNYGKKITFGLKISLYMIVCAFSNDFGITGTTLTTGLENIKGFKTLTATKFTSCQCLRHLCNTAELMHKRIMRQNMSASDHSLSMSQCQTAEVATKTQDEVSHCRRLHSGREVYKNRHMHKPSNILQCNGKYKSDDCYQITCMSGDTKHNRPTLQQRNSQ
jgi:hypothetical protein